MGWDGEPSAGLVAPVVREMAPEVPGDLMLCRARLYWDVPGCAGLCRAVPGLQQARSQPAGCPQPHADAALGN